MFLLLICHYKFANERNKHILYRMLIQPMPSAEMYHLIVMLQE